MTEPSMVKETRDGAVAVLAIDNPARRNALSMPVRQALLAALERAEADPAVRAIVITGAGSHFSSGGDISGMDTADLAAGRQRFMLTHAMVRLLAKGSKPAVAAVEGWCAGAGVGLALCCDTVVAATDAHFVTPFGRVGLIPDFGLLHTLPLRVGAGRAKQMLLYGDAMDAAQAERIGLADHLAPPGTALEVALLRAHRLAATAPLPLAYTRQHFAAGLDALLDWERDVQSALFLTADHAEGRAAFMAKRSPVFKGR